MNKTAPFLLLLLTVFGPAAPARVLDDDTPQLRPAAPTMLWAALAIDDSTPNPKGGANIALGYARRITRTEAEREAILSCQQAASFASACKIRTSYNSGCLYIATGAAPWGGIGWSTATTPQAAYDKCHANSLDCAIPVYGGCANTAEDRSRTNIVPAPKLKYWIALAAGRDTNSTHKLIAVSSAAGMTEQHARARAVASCNKSYPNEVFCEAVDAFNKGCGFIANAKQSPGSQMNWASSSTAQGAYDRCQSDGSTCDTKTTGACIQ